MNTNLTKIVFVLDRSGSMISVANSAIDGFNNMLREQKNTPGEAVMTLVLFDHEYLVVADSADIQSVQPLTSDTYVPRGNTAMYDAIGRAITDAGNQLAAMPELERPGKVVLAIMTDGQENGSINFTQERVAAMIKEQTEKYSWAVVFLGANIDVSAVSKSLNIPGQYAIAYAGDASGTSQAMHTLSSSVSEIRGNA